MGYFVYLESMATNGTLLCIHQDPSQLRLLEESGYQLLTANNGPDGLRLVTPGPVDAVVIEHQMGILDASLIAAEIKRVRPQVPIVMLVDHLELPEGALASADALVAKSDGAHFLWAMVHFVLNVKPTQRRAQGMRVQMPASSIFAASERGLGNAPQAFRLMEPAQRFYRGAVRGRARRHNWSNRCRGTWHDEVMRAAKKTA